VVFCICMILPTWELKAQKICLGSQPCTPMLLFAWFSPADKTSTN
jgi:hypothetical protein